MNILIIEDEKALAEAIAHILQKKRTCDGYRIRRTDGV